MPSVLPALNEHIRRLARREVRAQTVRTKRAAAQHRRDIAALKRTIKALTTRLAQLEKQAARGGGGAVVTAEAPAERLRFRADGLRTHRAKLGLSAKDYGKLVGVSGLTIYHWEAGKSKPRRKQLPALAAVRGLGKREALKRLNGDTE
jgi:DNA-binding XRE family transcriptional regulator